MLKNQERVANSFVDKIKLGLNAIFPLNFANGSTVLNMPLYNHAESQYGSGSKINNKVEYGLEKFYRDAQNFFGSRNTSSKYLVVLKGKEVQALKHLPFDTKRDKAQDL